jgi:hypothetical protein
MVKAEERKHGPITICRSTRFPELVEINGKRVKYTITILPFGRERGVGYGEW